MSRSSGSLLNTKISGHGPVVVLLHGYLSSLHYWDDLRGLLEKDYTVVAMDLLGFGNSPKPKESDYDYDDQIASIKRTLAHHNLDDPILLIGHSMGALLALRYASVRDQPTDRLLLLNMPVFSDAKEARRELAGTNLLYRAGFYWGLHRLIWPVLRTKPAREALKRKIPLDWYGVEKAALQPSAESRSRSLRNVIEAQSSIEDLKSLTTQVTLVVGLRDRPIYLKNLRRFARSAEFQVIVRDTEHNTLGEDFDFIAGLL
ncbi:MAG TPA: alpha/beta fold hydrolase [Candidatus Saccharimonadales bacterium]|nr:alpha/beta fold hydrolase [Candidatus Saccharimonadales bacterium]